MLDFEKSLQNAIHKNFEGVKISGCYFHYFKILREKAKRFGLCTKADIKVSKILLFILKLMPYIQYDEIIGLFSKIEQFYNNNDKYIIIIKYYKKTWLKITYLNYDEITQNEYLNKTDNLQNFYHLLNHQLEFFHPKLSYLVEKYKFFIKNVYIKIKESLVKEIPNKNNKLSIIDDIYNYLSSYNKKYSEKIDIHKIIQVNNKEFDIINKITKYLTELFFNLDYGNEDDKLSKNNNVSNSDDNNNKNNLDEMFVSEYEKETNKINDL